ncbi:MAG: 1-acyl-sn-glycerol-3-phosphate acyltransferase [Clostridiales bacterium]|nr:1-acyl-sn-glycerol-3-phosphate acyltransferase [Clostridiales bacterium]
MEQEMVRHRQVYGFLKATLGGIISSIYGFHPEKAKVGKGPFLITANHNGDLDPALIALSFPEHMYFVASEHIFRKGFASWLLTYFFAPIARVKGMTDATAALSIIRTIRKKANVCLFAEGNRSYNGVTGPIFPATGKLAKATGASLVTYRFEGGYLTTPRWSHSTRKGRMRGYVVNVYTPEQLKQMTPEEVNDRIREDIMEDAFDRQLTMPYRYKGRDLAKGLENALYFCPKCGRTGTLRSEGDAFCCDCGLRVRFTETGFFEKVSPDDPEPPFRTVRDWDFWQDRRIVEYANGLGDDETAYSDENVKLIAIGEKHRSRVAQIGRLSISKRAMSVGDLSFPLSSISSMGLMGTYKMMFSVDGKSYELRAAKTPYCGRKYFTFFELMKRNGGQS